MAVIKVQSTLFSTVKTVGRALNKMEIGDEILIMNGQYKETLTIQHNALIKGNEKDQTILMGTLIIPKNIHVTLKNMTLKVTEQLYIEGTLHLEEVTLVGHKATSLVSVNKGHITCHRCEFSNASDLGIAALNNSIVTMKECRFSNNGKSHLYAENSVLRIIDCKLTNANHALWAKNESKVTSQSNLFEDHTGTQIIIQNQSEFNDTNSKIINGNGNGILANELSIVTLDCTILHHHKMPQLWIQNSSLYGMNCDIQHGDESAIMLKSNAEAEVYHSYFSNHKIANVQVTKESRLQLANSQLLNSDGSGIHIRENSITNIEQSTIKNSKLSQVFITENSIVSFKECEILKGHQLGIYVENNSHCTLLSSKLYQHPNTAITVADAEIVLLECEIFENAGNGVLSLHNSIMTIEHSKFQKNEMPHIAGKEHTTLVLIDCQFRNGKSIYMLNHSKIEITDCLFEISNGVQIEINEQTKLTLEKCTIKNGKSNAIKASKNSTLTINQCHITEHKLPQVVINDSSLIFKNSELMNGERNGFIIENYSEALIEDSFISKHHYPQIWIDRHSTVEMKATQITDGNESDIYVQNNSSLYADQCIIRNDRFQFNVQAVNFSKIDLTKSIVENKIGDEFYIENNSFITHEVDGEK